MQRPCASRRCLSLNRTDCSSLVCAAIRRWACFELGGAIVLRFPARSLGPVAGSDLELANTRDVNRVIAAAAPCDVQEPVEKGHGRSGVGGV